MQPYTLGNIAYEITNYLGNVNAVISDRKTWVSTVSAFKAVVLSKTDYFPYACPPRRMFNDTWFSGTESLSGINPEWSFSGTSGEQDNETKGEGNSYTTEFRQYDPRIGRWLSLDPLMAQFPWQSPYCAFDNNPVYFTDPLGLAAEGGPGDPEKVQQCAEVTIRAKKQSLFMKITRSLVGEAKKVNNKINEGVKNVGAFFAGVANAIGSNSLLGAGRMNPESFGKYSRAAKLGQHIGDAISFVQGLGEVAVGAAGNVLGGALDVTGVGTILGVPVHIGSTALATHGVTVISTVTSRVIVNNMESSTSDKMNDSGGSSKGSSSDSKSFNQLNQDDKKGKTPRAIKRFDKGKDTKNLPQDEVTFTDNSSLYRDGTWRHHYGHKLTKKQIKYLKQNGWKIPNN